MYACVADVETVATGAPAVTTPQLLTVQEVADAMRVSNMTVYRLIKAGELVATRVGRNYRIFESDVAAYLARGTG